MSRSRAELKEDLIRIQDETLSEDNRYNLNKAAKANLKKVLDTMLYLIDNIDKLVNNKHTFYGRDIAPVHLENHPLGQDREASLFNSLIEMFIISYNNVKAVSNNKVNQFCSRLAGNCIEMRTRKAFDFGLRFGNREAPAWRAKLIELTKLLENTRFDGTTILLDSDEFKMEFNVDDREDPEAEEDAYLNYLLAVPNRKKLLEMVTRFYQDDFILTPQNTPIVLRIVEHFCFKAPNTAGELLYQNIHKRDKDAISNCMIENDVNLNVAKEIDDACINTAFRAISHGASAETVANLFDYGAEMPDELVSDTYLAAISEDDNGYALYVLIQNDPEQAQRFCAELDSLKESNGTIAVLTDDGKKAKRINYHTAKLTMLRAMATAENEGCEFTYSKIDKKIFLDDLIKQISNLNTIEQCLHFYDDHIKQKILTYERFFNSGLLSFKGVLSLTGLFSDRGVVQEHTGSTVTFIEAIQQKILRLLAPPNFKDKPAITRLNQIEKTLRHPLFSKANITKGVDHAYFDKLSEQAHIEKQKIPNRPARIVNRRPYAPNPNLCFSAPAASMPSKTPLVGAARSQPQPVSSATQTQSPPPRIQPNPMSEYFSANPSSTRSNASATLGQQTVSLSLHSNQSSVEECKNDAAAITHVRPNNTLFRPPQTPLLTSSASSLRAQPTSPASADTHPLAIATDNDDFYDGLEIPLTPSPKK
jgi:hypothetical protein